MTSPRRRQPYDRQPSLRASARAKTTARGWAASKGVRIPYAKETGRTSSTPLKPGPDPDTTCTAVEWCDSARLEGFLWCEDHVKRARNLGAVTPHDL